MTFKSLMVVVTVLTLLFIAQGARSWNASEPMVTKSEANVSGNKQIVFEEDVLSVSLKDADLREVLKEISRQSNIEMSINGSVKEKVTLEFANLPLEKGLKRLLKNQNYSFTYLEKKDTADKKTRYVLSRVVLLEDPTSNQREAGQDRVVSEKVQSSPASQVMGLNEISTEMINELLSQDPHVQEETLKTLSEKINSNLRQIHIQLGNALERSSQQKVDKNFPGEALERLLREGGIEDIKSVIPE